MTTEDKNFKADWVVTQRVVSGAELEKRKKIAKLVQKSIQEVGKTVAGVKKEEYNIGMLGYSDADGNNKLLIALSGRDKNKNIRLIKSEFEGQLQDDPIEGIEVIRWVDDKEAKDPKLQKYFGFGTQRENVDVAEYDSSEGLSLTENKQKRSFLYRLTDKGDAEIYYRKGGELKKLYPPERDGQANDQRVENEAINLIIKSKGLSPQGKKEREAKLFGLLIKAGYEINTYLCSEPKLAGERLKLLLFTDDFQDKGETYFGVIGGQLQKEDRSSCGECCYRGASYRGAVVRTEEQGPEGQEFKGLQVPSSSPPRTSDGKEGKKRAKKSMAEALKLFNECKNKDPHAVTGAKKWAEASKKWAEAMYWNPKAGMEENFLQFNKGQLSLAVFWFTSQGDKRFKRAAETSKTKLSYENALMCYEQAIYYLKKQLLQETDRPKKEEISRDLNHCYWRAIQCRYFWLKKGGAKVEAELENLLLITYCSTVIEDTQEFTGALKNIYLEAYTLKSNMESKEPQTPKVNHLEKVIKNWPPYDMFFSKSIATLKEEKQGAFKLQNFKTLKQTADDYQMVNEKYDKAMREYGEEKEEKTGGSGTKNTTTELLIALGSKQRDISALKAAKNEYKKILKQYEESVQLKDREQDEVVEDIDEKLKKIESIESEENIKAAKKQEAVKKAKEMDPTTIELQKAGQKELEEAAETKKELTSEQKKEKKKAVEKSLGKLKKYLGNKCKASVNDDGTVVILSKVKDFGDSFLEEFLKDTGITLKQVEMGAQLSNVTAEGLLQFQRNFEYPSNKGYKK